MVGAPTTSTILLHKTRFLARLDSGLLVTLALCLFALWPLVVRPGLPNGDDVLYHVYRAAEMNRSWSHGMLMPRWAESFYTGYGAPLFHYYASLTYYVTSIFARLFALDAVNSLRLLIVLCVLGGGAGMYGFVQRYAGSTGGVIAALCFVYSPYLLFTEPYSRGAYPELMAFALFPALMWSYSHLIATGKASSFVLAVLLEAALIITHNLMALVLTGLLVAWLIWSLATAVITQRSEKADSRVIPQFLALLAVALGIGLAAYFWLPVTQEGGAVKLSNLTGVAELNYRNFFVPIVHQLEPNPRPDAGALNGLEHRLNLGVPQWTLAVTGVIGIAALYMVKDASTTKRAFHLYLSTSLFFGLAALALIALILSASAPIWETVVPLAYLQFPWRLLGPAVFCLSVLAGMNALWLERLPHRVSGVLTAALVLFIIGMAAPTLYVTEWTNETVDTSVAAYHDAELRGFQRATTFSNEYLPATVAVEPGATPRLLADYADGYPVNKVHLEALPSDVSVEVLEHNPQQDMWRVSAPEPFIIEVLTYAFPGWTAEIDGQIAPITSSDPHGLITFLVPAGDHIVRLYLGSTPPRDLGNAITLIAVFGTIGVGLAIFCLRGNRQLPTTNHRFSIAHPSSHLTRYLLFGGLITLAFLLVYLREGGAWVNSPPGEAVLAQHQITYNVGDQIQLIGYDLSGEVFRPGDRLEVVVYWYAREQPDYGYSSFVHVVGDGMVVAQADKLNPAGLPTVDWSPDGHIRDEYVITLPDMPGEYQLLAGLWTCQGAPEGACGTGRPTVTDSEGNEVGDAIPLGTITLR
jgi:hypothetical protein